MKKKRLGPFTSKRQATKALNAIPKKTLKKLRYVHVGQYKDGSYDIFHCIGDDSDW